MEELKHKNDIEIKLLPNRRFTYANRKSNIVITAEHLATEITVLFPEEYEDYSKRVDFVNSRGKEWTEGLYTPEYKHRKYPHGFNKSRFHFSLPAEVTTEGELKMQFMAYKPDKSMTTVPFEVIPIDVLDGVLAFKRNARSNPDLLILAANQSAESLFNSQRAAAKSEKAERISNKAEAQSKAAIVTANRTEKNLAAETAERKQADEESNAAIKTETSRATQAEADITAALDIETATRISGHTVIAQAITDERARAKGAEADLAAGLEAEAIRAAAAEGAIARDLAAESQRAMQAEETIAADLAAGMGQSALACEDNAQAIAEETIRAIGAESSISAALAAEISRALTAERLNADATDAETGRALSAEAGLQSRIDVEKQRAETAENSLKTELANEFSRAIQAEAGISAGLNAEAARARNAEQINEAAIGSETERAVQAENALGRRLDIEVPAAVTEAKAYANQMAEQVRIDGTVYRGTAEESELPGTGENGDLYWITDFNVAKPGHSGSAIWNGAANKWDFNIDRYKHQDNDTIVARESDGALKVCDTDEINLTADAADFGGAVQSGFKATIRSLIRKIKGLFQKAGENAAAVAAETARAATAESGLSSRISAEEIRAEAAGQINASAIQAETQRAAMTEGALAESIAAETARAQTAEQSSAAAITAETQRAQTAESGLVSRISAEEIRAVSAEQTNATAVAAETARALTAESGLAASVLTEKTRAIAAEQMNAAAVAAEETRAMLAEQALAQNIIAAAEGVQSDWNVDDEMSPAYIKNRPASMPASDVHPWAKAANKPAYTPDEVGAEPAFNKNTAFNKDFGTGAGTVCEGDDPRLSNGVVMPKTSLIIRGDGTGGAAAVAAAANQIIRGDGTSAGTVGNASTPVYLDNGVPAACSIEGVVFSIALEVSSPGNLYFESLPYGGTDLFERTLTVRNNGNQPTGDLRVTLSSGAPVQLMPYNTAIASVPVSGTYAVRVITLDNLPLGIHDFNIIIAFVNGKGASRSVSGSCSVISQLLFDRSQLDPRDSFLTLDITDIYGESFDYKLEIFLYDLTNWLNGQMDTFENGATRLEFTMNVVQNITDPPENAVFYETMADLDVFRGYGSSESFFNVNFYGSYFYMSFKIFYNSGSVYQIAVEDIYADNYAWDELYFRIEKIRKAE